MKPKQVRTQPPTEETQAKAKVTLILERFLPYRLSIVTSRISSALSRHYAEPFGISIPEWRVIALLGRHPGISAGEVAERSAMDKVTVSRAVTALLGKKLIERQRDDGDRRRSQLELSPRGLELYGEVVPRALAFEKELLSVLEPEELGALDAILDKLGAKIDTMG